MATFVGVQIQGGDSIIFKSGAAAQLVTAFLRDDPRAGAGSLCDKDGVAVLPGDELTAEHGPYVFRRSTGAGVALVPLPADTSAASACQLVSSPLDSVPGLQHLQQHLLAMPPHPLPVIQRTLDKLRLDAACQCYMQHFTAQHTAHDLALIVSAALESSMLGTSEPWTALQVNKTLVAVLAGLDALLPVSSPARLGLQLERDEGDKMSGMTCVSEKLRVLRPDGVIRYKDGVRLLFKWEEKGAGDGQGAMQDLGLKLAVWPEVYYGPLQYLLTVGAAGRELQFYAIERASMAQPRPIGPAFHMDSLSGRAGLVLASVQLYRFLGAVAEALPPSIAPVNKLLKHTKYGITTTIFFNEALVVQKAVHPWGQYSRWAGADLHTLQRVYAATRACSGLVHSRAGFPRLSADIYEVELEPVGIHPASAAPVNELQFACAVLGFLTGLAALHERGFVHRDVRRENMSCDARKQRYFLLDLELCDRAGSVPCTRLSHWDPSDTLVEGRYTAQSDIQSLGMVLQGWRACVQSPEGRRLLGEVSLPAAQQQRSAQQLLQEAAGWFAALGII